ncbi:TPA: exodeoxyribonuclease V subunit beta, partial [Vibrio vulnificus]|nr:exodeoxyribonuclease V subunit beta [Vibrio vulnificus]
KQGSHQSDYDASLEVVGFDIDSSAEDPQAPIQEVEKSIFSFPRGASAGTFLHSLFEEVEFTQAADSEQNRQVITELMEKNLIDLEWLPVLQLLVDTVLSTPLDGKHLYLNQKTPSQRLVEMEFLLPIEVLSAASLNKVIQRHDPLSARAGDLGFQTVQGMLKGFIDLVFEHQGKYYVLDWKSNHLGDAVHFYHGEALQGAMVDHRYDLQYQIYALALHRFLRSRLANYDYQHHFGGVYYLFLRGMDGESEHGIFSAKPSLDLLTEMDRLIDGLEPQPRSTQGGQMELL